MPGKLLGTKVYFELTIALHTYGSKDIVPPIRRFHARAGVSGNSTWVNASVCVDFPAIIGEEQGTVLEIDTASKCVRGFRANTCCWKAIYFRNRRSAPRILVEGVIVV